VPVDYLAETIAALMLQAGSERRCFHIVNRKQLGMKDLAGLLTQCGYHYRRVPYDVWKTLVAEGGNACLLPLLPLLNAYKVSALVSDFLIDPTNTYTALHNHRPELLDSMPTSTDCVSALIQYAQKTGDIDFDTKRPGDTHGRIDEQATKIDYPKLAMDKSRQQGATVMTRQIVGKQALAITQHTDHPEVFFRVLFADALRRWSQPQFGLAVATARVAGMDSHFEWSSGKVSQSLLDGRSFDQHLREANQTRQPLLWLQDESDTQPVAFAYLECSYTEPRDKQFLSQFQCSLRDELEREHSALVCEVSSLETGWEIQWRLAPSVEPEFLKNAFDYFMACIDDQCDADWAKPMSFEVFLPFIGPSTLANRTQAAYPSALSIHALFLEQAERTPAAMAIRHCSGNLTYGELRAQVLRLADYINKQIPGRERLVGLYCNRNPSALAAMLAIGLSGNAFIPLDPSYPEDRLSMMLQQSKAPLVLADKDLSIPAVALAPEGTAVISIDQILLSDDSLDSNYSPTQAKQLMYVMFTSGSTGRPKGVMIEQRSVVNFVHSVADTLGAKAQGDWMAVSSFSFDISMMELFVPLTTGLCVVLASSEQARDAQQLHEMINTHQPKVMHATPATWTMLLDAGFTNPQNMLVLSGADTLGEGLKNRLCNLGCSLWNFYGPTETTIYSAVKKMTPNETVSIGKPLANTTLYVLDNDWQPTPVGVPGELYIGGDGLARGFLNQPELTAERFVELSVANQPSARYFRTGDLAQLRPNGDIACMGRLDHQIKLRGYRIEIDEIESVIDSHEQVSVSAVVVQGTGEHRQLSAFVVPVADPGQQAEDSVL
ncbi:amino acid adenylation domain-containing protein, partial [bacterium]|nr:amino acid adenylation domain-containing protein [bacterium]